MMPLWFVPENGTELVSWTYAKSQKAKNLSANPAVALHWQEHPKSEAGERALRLPATMLGMLTERRVHAGYQQVFPSSTGTWRWPANTRRQWRAALEGTIYAGATPKDFRRAVATHLDRQVGLHRRGGDRRR